MTTIGEQKTQWAIQQIPPLLERIAEALESLAASYERETLPVRRIEGVELFAGSEE